MRDRADAQMNAIIRLFRRPTPLELAARQLADAELARLRACAELEAHAAYCNMLDARITRLREELRNAQDDKLLQCSDAGNPFDSAGAAAAYNTVRQHFSSHTQRMSTQLAFSLTYRGTKFHVVGEFWPGDPGCAYRSNGDPGDPPTPPELDITAVDLTVRDEVVSFLDFFAGDDDFYDAALAEAERIYLRSPE